MATRSTYLFEAGDWKPAVCIYDHWDGYLEGAAVKIYKAFLSHGHDVTAESFIRANSGAKICRDHDSHSDTEYRYTFGGIIHSCGIRHLTVHEIVRDLNGPRKWRVSLSEDWVTFVNEYAPRMLDDFEPVCRVPEMGYRKNVLMTRSMAQKRIKANQQTIGQWLSTGAYKSIEAANIQALIAENRALSEIK